VRLLYERKILLWLVIAVEQHLKDKDLRVLHVMKELQRNKKDKDLRVLHVMKELQRNKDGTGIQGLREETR